MCKLKVHYFGQRHSSGVDLLHSFVRISCVVTGYGHLVSIVCISPDASNASATKECLKLAEKLEEIHKGPFRKRKTAALVSVIALFYKNVK